MPEFCAPRPLPIDALAKLYRGFWDPRFGPKTRLLLIDALTRMNITKDPVNENALRSVAVRLYGIYRGNLQAVEPEAVWPR